MNALRLFTMLLLWSGVLVMLLSCVGLLRAQNVYDRLHFLGPPTVLALPLVCAAVVLGPVTAPDRIKAGLVAGAVFAISPVLTHATARAAREREQRTRRDGSPEDKP